MRPLDLAAFPTVLLLATLLRLALNVASTRVVLLHGHTGTDSAGKVIEAFGEFVIGGNYAVGIVVFAILVIVNWFAVLIRGRTPEDLHLLLARALRYRTHVFSYLFLASNPYPTFFGRPGAHPVDLQLDGPLGQRRIVGCRPEGPLTAGFARPTGAADAGHCIGM